MSTRTHDPECVEEGHPKLWGPGMEPGAWGRETGAREAYDAQLLAEGVRVVPAPRQSPEEGR